MSRKNQGDKVDQLVEAKFTADGFTIDRKDDSPNARHFVLQRDGETKHLKVIKKTYIQGNEYSEIDLLKSISSENVIELEDHGDVDDKHVYLLFPHINGVTLNKMRRAGGWDETSLRQLIRDVVAGLRDIEHAGVVHQDIKPGNIIYDNVNMKYVILDLGIGFFIEGPNKNNTAIPKGKGPRYYSAPEQFKIAIGEPYSPYQTVDQFSFGSILYELATDAHPFIAVNDKEAQSYATLVMDQGLPKQINRSGKLSNELCGSIEKMLRKDPSQRFLNISDLETILRLKPSAESPSRSLLYLKMPSKGKEDFTAIAHENKEHIHGVVLSPSDSVECAQSLDNLDIPIVLDPKTYNLQINESTEKLSKKLGIPYSASYNVLSLYKLKDQLLDGVHALATRMHSSIVVLPYFNVHGAGTEYLELTKEIWRDARPYYEDKGRDATALYAGIIVPHSVIISQKERSKLMSQLMAKYPLAGIVVTFENVDKSISTTVDPEYLKGIKEMCAFFESIFKNVIVYQTDLSVLPFMSDASYATGWSKKSRHFNFNKAGGGGKRPPYKMKLFAKSLFGFIEERSKVQTISLMGKATYLKCSCSDCAINDPTSSQYREDEGHEKRHFFREIAALHGRVANLKPSERRAHFRVYLAECEKNAGDIKSSGVIGNETIPSYKGLIALIDS